MDEAYATSYLYVEYKTWTMNGLNGSRWLRKCGGAVVSFNSSMDMILYLFIYLIIIWKFLAV